MNVGWNFRREHLRLTQRSHYVITNGGDQPNVVPRNAGVWYYFRETDYPHIKELWDIGNKIAEGAALMTNTKWSSRILGTAWPQHFNKIDRRRRCTRTSSGSACRRGARPTRRWPRRCRRSSATPKQEGLATKLDEIGKPVAEEDKRGGGSDDIGDVSWNMPTVTLRYPANIPGLPGHNWSNAIAMATPIAHKGVVAGAKVQAMTMLDILTTPALVTKAWDYFNNVQTKDEKYIPFIAKDTPPPTWLNKAILDKYRPEMKKFYYDPTQVPDLPRPAGDQVPDGARRRNAVGRTKERRTKNRSSSFVLRSVLDALARVAGERGEQAVDFLRGVVEVR